MAKIELPFGRRTLCVEIPDTVLGEVVSPDYVQAAADPDAVIEGALCAPIPSPPIEEIVRPDQKVAVIINDVTRKTPVHLMLPCVLERLTMAGIFPRTSAQ
jgi:nickel-dependent lactate racemase